MSDPGKITTNVKQFQRWSDYPCPQGHHNVSLLVEGRPGAPEIWACGDCGWKGSEAQLVAPPPMPRARLLNPEYVLDYESVADCVSPEDAVVFLRDVADRPGWQLHKTCRSCEEWDSSGKQDLTKMPKRPMARDSSTGCNGCIFSFLDHKDEKRLETDPAYWREQRTRADQALRRLKGEGAGLRAVAMAEARVLELQNVRKRWQF